jgi:hypothetical protein
VAAIRKIRLLEFIFDHPCPFSALEDYCIRPAYNQKKTSRRAFEISPATGFSYAWQDRPDRL